MKYKLFVKIALVIVMTVLTALFLCVFSQNDNVALAEVAPPTIDGVSADVTQEYDGLGKTVSVTASHSEGASLSYAWYKDEALQPTLTSSSFTVKNVADSGTYYCIVSVAEGSASTKSSSVSVAITPHSITVSAQDKAIDYLSATGQFVLADFSSQLVGGDEATVVDQSSLLIVTNYITGADVGSYYIRPSGLSAVNYSFIYSDGTLTVRQIDQAALSFSTDTLTYGGSAFSLTAITLGGSSTGALSFSVDFLTLSGSLSGNSLTMTKAGGDVSVTVQKEGDTNYKTASHTATIHVAKGAQSAVFTDASPVFGDGVDLALEGVLDGADVSYTLVTGGGAGTATAEISPQNVLSVSARGLQGTAVVKATVEATALYSQQILTHTFTFSKRPVTAPASGGSSPYTGSLQRSLLIDTTLYTITQNDGGTEAGDYPVTLTLRAPQDNCWADSPLSDKTLAFTVTQAQNSWSTVFSIANVGYGEALSVSGVAVFGTPTIRYSTTSDGDFVPTVPHNAGTYYARATVAETSNYTGLFSAVSFTIEQFTVTLPSISSKPYNGLPQTASVADSAYYTVTQNDGGTVAGEYNVELTLTDSTNYAFEGTTLPVKVLKFNIVSATNSFTTTPSVASFVYGESVTTPVGVAQFGQLSVMYTNREGGAYVTETPVVAGKYWAKFAVDATDDYGGLLQIVPFTIFKAAVAVPLAGEKVYTGEPQRSSLTDTSLYTVVSNSGGTAAGDYTVTVRLVRFTSYRWADETDESNVREKTITFTIVPAQNLWIVAPSIENYSYGETGSPTATAQFGQVAYSYAVQGTDNYSSALPTAVGAYTLKAVVAATENYSGLVQTVPFSVDKANVEVGLIYNRNTLFVGDVFPVLTADCDVEGTIEWLGAYTTGQEGQIDAQWRFTPSNTEGYNVATGTERIIVHASKPTSLQLVQAPLRTQYSAFDLFDAEGMIIRGVTESGTFVNNLTGYTLRYASAQCFHAGDTIITVCFAQLTLDVPVTVQRLQLARPTPDNNVVFDGTEKSSGITDTEQYSVSGGSAVEAGQYIATVTLTDPLNYAWQGAEEAAVSISWQIARAPSTVRPLYDMPATLYTTSELPSLRLSEGDTNGTIEWAEYTVKAGTHEYSWNFVPKNENYAEATGTISFSATAATLRELVVVTPITAYKAFDSFDITGMRVYGYNTDNSTVGQVLGYTVEYQDGRDSFRFGDQAVYVCYGGIRYEVSVTVSRLTVQRPQPTVTEYTYDGTEKSLDVPTVSHYSAAGLTAKTANEYSAVFTLTDSDNCCWDDATVLPYTLPWRINKGVIDLSAMAWEYSGPYTYNGALQRVTVSGVPAQVTVSSYVNAEQTNAGAYTAKAVLAYDTQNYLPIAFTDLNWSIEQATLDVSGVTWDYTGAKTYNGQMQYVRLQNLPEGVSVQSYLNCSKQDSGTYFADVILRYDTVNYTAVDIPGLEWTIDKATYDMSRVTFTDATYSYDGTAKRLQISGSLPTGVAVSYTENTLTEVGTVVVTATFKGSKNYYEVPPKSARLTVAPASVSAEGGFKIDFCGEIVSADTTLKVAVLSAEENEKAINKALKLVNGQKLYALYEIDLVGADTLQGKAVTLRMPIPPQLLQQGKNLSAVYVAEDGTVTVLPSRVTEDGYLEFSTTHFSTYGIIADEIPTLWWLYVIVPIILAMYGFLGYLYFTRRKAAQLKEAAEKKRAAMAAMAERAKNAKR